MWAKRFWCVLIAEVILSAASSAASAQQSRTATYFDWILQCANDTSTPPKKVCDIFQTTQVQGKNFTFSRIGIETPIKGKPVKLITQFPVNVSVRSPVEIQFPDSSTPSISAPFDRCVPAGCFAEIELKSDILKKFNAIEDGRGKVTFKDAGGRDMAVPLSFKGFRSAFEALSKE